MKKSEINTEDLIEDIDKLLDILNRVGENNIEDIDIDNIPLTRPTTKLVAGTFLIVFGAIQLFPLLG